MAKKKSHIMDFNESIYEEDKRIERANIADLNTENLKIYGANINLARVFPEIHDGLKLVERRILFAMYFLAKAVKRSVKSHTIVGQTLMIHAHGDASVYQTLVRLAQPWNMEIPYVTGIGGFGTIAGDDAAASRYTEAMLSPYAIDCFFSDWNPDIVLMVDTYNRDLKEPSWLPTKYPNCLLSSADGMGFGPATHIPTFNLAEVLQATIKLIEDPSYEPYLVPDITTGCLIVDEGNFESICKTGGGPFKMRAEIEKDEDHKCLIIRSIPFQVSLLQVKEKIKELVETKVIVGFKEMKDYSASKIHLELYFKPEVDLENIINILYVKTRLQETYPVQIKMVDDFTVVDFSVKSALLRWIDIRHQFKRNVFINRMVKLEQRNHILRVLIMILEGKNAEKTVSIIKNSSKEEIVTKLVKEYNITTLQAKEISNMRLNAFSKSARTEYLIELKDNEKEIASINKTIKNRKAISKIIIKELEEGIQKYQAPRRSRVIKIEKEYKYSSYEVCLTFTKHGYVKKLKNVTKKIGNLGNLDEAIDVKICNNRDSIVIFDKKGMVHCLEVGQISNDDLTTIGTPLSTYINIAGEPVAIFKRQNITETTQFVFITKKGIVKKTDASNYALKNSIVSITVKPDDELIGVIAVDREKDILVYTHGGFGLRFHTKEIPSTKRLAIGVTTFTLADNDYVVGVKEINSDDKYIFIATEDGYVKKCGLEVLSPKKRRSEPVSLIPLNKKDGVFEVISCKDSDSIDVIMMKKGLYNIKVKDLKSSLKFETGERLIPVNKTDNIVKIFKATK